jgi:glycosyltransferase involved in cell wall biosynthesis
VVSERSTGLGQSRWRLTLERLLASRAEAFVVNSTAMADEVLSLIPQLRGRLFVVPNGVLWTEPTAEDVARAGSFREKHLGDAELLLLALSRLSREKGPDVLVEALARVADDTRARLRVLWMGACVDAELGREVQTRVEGGPLHGRVVFLPPTEDTTSAYLASDALVLPSRREGLPNVVLEALAHGRPVIASDVGDARLVIDGSGAGWLVPPDDPDALAGALNALVAAGEQRRKEMGVRGSAFVLREFSTERLVERTTAVYSSVLSGRGRSRTGDPE